MKNISQYKLPATIGIVVIGLFLLSIDFQNNESYQESTISTEQANTRSQASHLQDNENKQAQAQEPEAPLAPLFTLEDVDGKSVSLADFKGKIVFVNFWATWCPPCRAEIPDFVKLINKYGDDGFEIIGVSVDKPDDYNKIPGFMDQYKMNYPVVLDKMGQVNYMYGGIQSIPTTFVLDREGRALGRIVGARSYEQFEDILKQVL